jgi:Flp pilus assembly secretin CpaC
MRFLFPFVALAFVTAVASPVIAQDPAPAQASGATLQSTSPGPPKFLNQNVRIDVTIALKGEAKPLLKNLSMVAGDGRETKGRAGIEVPVPTSFAAGTTAPITYQYRSVGVNVDATPQVLDATHVLLRMNIQFSTVYKPESGQAQQPSFGQGSHEVRGIVFESGKSVVVTQAADGETGREYTVEVRATLLK